MDVSIIIVNYNTISFLIDAINTILEKTTGIKYEIIIIDNNSTDNSKRILSEEYGEKVICIGLSENIGFGRANNEAAKNAKGRNLFFLNPDTILLNNAVKMLSDYLDNNPQVGCCGGNLLDIDGKPIHSFLRFIAPGIFAELNNLFLKMPEKIIYGKNVFYNHTNKPIKVGYITGADLMIRKEIFDKLDGFDPDFFMYCEETELEYRVQKMGYKIISIPYALIVHLERKSITNNFDKMKNYLVSRAIFLKNTHNPISILFINMLFHFKSILYILLFTIFQDKEKRKLWSEIYKLNTISLF